MSAASLVAVRMATPVRVRILQRLFSFPGMLCGLLLVLTVFSVRSRFDDPDIWWHLKTGEIIWKTHTIPTTDIYSFTTHHQAYVPHEWLSQVLIYGAYKLGGYPGLMLWFCFFTSALLIAGYGLCSLYSENPKVGFLGALTIWLFATTGLSIRPQMVGYLFLVVELLLIHLGRTGNRRWLLGLPPLFAIWVNCHGSFFLGLVVLVAFFFSSFFDFQLGLLAAPRWDPRDRRILGLALVLSVVALFCNPIGVHQILYPLDALLHLPNNLSQVDEWQPLQLGDPRGLAFLGVLGSIFLLAIVRRAQLFWHELLVLALATWLSAGHRRMLFVFGILAAPILSRLLSSAWDGYDAEQDRPMPNAVFIAASLFVAFWAFPNQRALTRQVDEASPVKAVEFIKAHHLSGPMLNDYLYGGYLIWAAPENPVFIDGRGDVFEWTGVFEEFGRWATFQNHPTELLDKYKINFCLLTRGSPMVRVLPLLADWKEIYSDNNSVIIMRVPAGSHRNQ